MAGCPYYRDNKKRSKKEVRLRRRRTRRSAGEGGAPACTTDAQKHHEPTFRGSRRPEDARPRRAQAQEALQRPRGLHPGLCSTRGSSCCQSTHYQVLCQAVAVEIRQQGALRRGLWPPRPRTTGIHPAIAQPHLRLHRWLLPLHGRTLCMTVPDLTAEGRGPVCAPVPRLSKNRWSTEVRTHLTEHASAPFDSVMFNDSGWVSGRVWGADRRAGTGAKRAKRRSRENSEKAL